MASDPDLPTSNFADVSAPPISTSELFTAGHMVGKYRIVSCLGMGGMGVVYKALDTQLQRLVALKFLPNRVARNEKEKRNLLREARAASSLDHPNLGFVYDVEETLAGDMFIAMAFHEGQTLSDRIQTQGLDTQEAIAIVRQIAAGLQHAHEHHVLHGDIKPSNILITPEGVVKIVDFGLARKTTATAATETGGIGGTVGYISPEQTMGKLVDQRSDIWSLGVVFFQMITGLTPFQRESAGTTLLAILNEPPSNMDLVTEELRPIIYRALAKSPAQRYQSCAEFLNDLNAVGADIPTSVKSRDLKKVVEAASHTTMSLPLLPRRSRAWVIAAAIVFLVAASFLVPGIRNRFFPDNGQKHIAVLPFEISGGESDEALSDGLMDTLTSRLSNLEVGQQSLWVVPATEIRRKKVSDPSAARKEFGANLVVTGSIVRDARNVQLTVNLIDPRRMRQIGSAVLSDASGDFSTLQEQAVSRLAQLMRIRLTPEMTAHEEGKVTPVAYESYLKGIGYMQRWDKPGNLDSAISSFTEATSADPNFALAYASMGEAYRLKFKLDSDTKWMAEASKYGERAAELNSQLPAVHVTLGRIHAETGKYELALQEFQQALQLDARNADALMGMGTVYEKVGRLKDAEAALQRSADLRPDYWDGYSRLGLFYYRQHRYADAEKQYRRVLELTPDNSQAYSNLAVMLKNQKKYGEAEAAFKKSILLSPTYAAYANLGNLYWDQNRFADCAAMTEEAIKLNDKDYRTWGNLALAYKWLGEETKAEDAYRHELERLAPELKLKPDETQLQSEMAIINAKLKQREQAIPLIRAALARAPNDPRVLVDAGETYEVLGDRKQAIHYVEDGLKQGFDPDEVRRNPYLQNLLKDPGFQIPIPVRKEN